MQNPNFPLRARPKDSTDKVCSNESLSSWHLECQNLIETTNSEANFSIFWHKISVLFFGWRPPLLLAARNVLPIKVAKKRSIQQCTHLGQNNKSFWFYVKAFIKSSQWNEFIWNNKTDVKAPLHEYIILKKHTLQISMTRLQSCMYIKLFKLQWS